ncbi:MAG TPA: septum formation initiator [Pseudonocardiaceae bacterium]|jgi:hypothetical protein|nr:septum formation initiator [Pseudonocardiaceae bacterium]
MTAPARKAAPTTPAKTSPQRDRTTGKSGTKSTVKPTGKTATRTTGKPGAKTGAKTAAKPLAPQPDGSGTARGRSAAAERAYARRAQRTRQPVGPKPERKPGSASRVTFVVLVMGLLIGGVVASLWFSTQATADAYALEQARAQTLALSQRVQRLQQQVANADSAPSLSNRARQLGMVPAGDPAHLVVGSNGAVTVIGSPTPVTSPPPLVTYSSPPPTTAPSAPPATSPVSPTTNPSNH